MIWFALASLTPAFLLVLACILGGMWPLIALISVTGFVLLADRAFPGALPVREDAQRAATGVSVVLGLTHFAVLALGVWAVAAAPYLDIGQTAALAVALGLYFGQVSNANAHELIHKSARWPRLLGKTIYATLLFGHHASAHPKVHHVWVASDRDPNSARLGEGFYRFWPRAWIGSFRAGLRAETRLREHAAVGRFHPYAEYAIGSALTLLAAFGLAGWAGVLVLLALATHAQMQLILSDYVQHYGLRRRVQANGRLEPVGPAHAWNAPQWYSSAMMLNAPRHSDHHINPGRPFPALRLDTKTMPVLPYSFPVMATAALAPPIWRRLMDPRVADWDSGAGTADLRHSHNDQTVVDSPVPAGGTRSGANAIERRSL